MAAGKKPTLDQRELAVISPLSRSIDMKLETATARSACAFSSAALFSDITLQHQPIKNHEQDINSRNECNQ